jgi:hypothetical protein
MNRGKRGLRQKRIDYSDWKHAKEIKRIEERGKGVESRGLV